MLVDFKSIKTSLIKKICVERNLAVAIVYFCYDGHTSLKRERLFHGINIVYHH